MEKSTLDWIALVLVIIGGLNWLLVGLFSFDIVSKIFGVGTVAKIIYVLIGVAALYTIYYLFKE